MDIVADIFFGRRCAVQKGRKCSYPERCVVDLRQAGSHRQHRRIYPLVRARKHATVEGLMVPD